MIISMCIALIFTAIPIFIYQFNAFVASSRGSWSAKGDPTVDKYEAFQMMSVPSEITQCITPELAQSHSEGFTFAIFKSKDGGDVFTRSRLSQISLVVDEFYALGTGQSAKYQFVNHCRLAYNTTDFSSIGCSNPRSPVPFFMKGGSLLDETSIAAKKETLRYSEEFVGAYGSRDFGETGDSFVTRVSIQSGRPLSNIDSQFCSYRYKPEDQDLVWEEFLENHYESFFKEKETDDLNVYFLNGPLIGLDIGGILNHDLAFVGGSISCVAIILYLETRSVFLSLMGMLHIILSFPAAAFIYRVIFNIEGYPCMNIMALFIIVGIGADDVFVMTDAFIQSAHQKGDIPSSLETRMDWAWKRSAKAMLVTSFTTFMAFVTTAASPIPTVSVFGVFAAAVVLCNYLLVITWYPAVLVLYSQFGWETNFPCASLWRKCGCNMPDKKVDVVSEPAMTEADLEAGEIKTINQYRSTERFYYKKLYNFLFKFTYYIFAFFVLLIIGSSIGASYFKKVDKMQLALPSFTTTGAALQSFYKDFSTLPSASYEPVMIVHGLKDPFIDRAGIDSNAEINMGKPVFDDTFSIISPVAQSWIASMCDKAVDAGLSFSNQRVGPKCIMSAFRDYLIADDHTFPVPAEFFYSNITSFASEPSQSNMEWHKYLDIEGLKEQGRFRYFYSVFTSFVQYTDFDGRDAEFAKWKIFIESQKTSIEVAGEKWLANSIFMTSEVFLRMQSVDLMTKSAFMNVGIAAGVAFIALLIVTGNLVVAFFALLTIGGTAVSSICMMVILGWRIDLLESVCITLLIGVSVDYTVHFGHAYVESDFKHRHHRTRHAITHLGVSVINAALTTLISTFFLFFCYFSFFTKFGSFLFVAIACSILYSHLFFTSLLIIAGPEGNTGNVYYFAQKYCKKDKRSKKREHEEQAEIKIDRDG